MLALPLVFHQRLLILMSKSLVLLFFLLLCSPALLAQNVNLDNYDVYMGDTLISKTDFLNKSKSLSGERMKQLKFRPISDGQKKYYYLNGQVYSEGEIRNKKENGFWTYWHENGQKAREGSFEQGKRTGTHTYWYPNGNLRGVGNFKDDKYDGKWTMYNEEGVKVEEQVYRNGELVKE